MNELRALWDHESPSTVVGGGGLVEFEDFDAWYTRARPEMDSAMCALGTPIDVAVDAVDEAFTRATEQWVQVEGMPNRDGWTYVVARNFARDTMRTETNRRRILRTHLSEAPVHEDPPPEVHELRRLLEPLNDKQREVVVLRNYFGMTEVEIADAIGSSRGTVSSRLRGAYKVLRRSTLLVASAIALGVFS